MGNFPCVRFHGYIHVLNMFLDILSWTCIGHVYFGTCVGHVWTYHLDHILGMLSISVYHGSVHVLHMLVPCVGHVLYMIWTYIVHV